MKTLNLSWLEDFQALAASGNFSRAAEERHMTQPAFSRRVRALEEWLGAELFDRTTQPATLTATGQWFVSLAADMLARAARMPDAAQAVAGAHASMLRMACTHALSLTFLPRWLRGLEEGLSIGPVSLVSDVLPRCEAMLLHEQVQFVLCHTHPDVPLALQQQAYPSLVVGSDRLVPVSAPDRHGKPRHRLPVRGAGADLLDYSPESGIGRLLRELKGAEIDALGLKRVVTAHTASVLRSMVLDGRGVAWLPQSLIDDDMVSGTLVPAAPERWQLPLQVSLFRDRNALAPAGEAFWRSVLKSAQRA